MSVRLKYAGDKDISAGRSGGASIFSLPGGASFPPAGTVLQTLNNVIYPLAQGGAQGGWQDPFDLGYIYLPTQTVTVPLVADGSGGSYLDWNYITNVAAIPFGTFVHSGSWATNNYSISTSCNGTVYIEDGQERGLAYADGYYGFYTTIQGQGFAPYGTVMYNESCDDGNGNYYDTYYYADGNGGYYQ
jgi:hypothetical protein